MNIIKKKIVILMLATSMAMNVYGCSAIEDNTIIENVAYNTEDYFLVYLDGNIYLTTREFKQRSYNYDHYDVRNGELVGKTLPMLRGENLEDEKSMCYEARYKDERIVAGEYGYGLIIPPYATIPLTNILSSQGFSQEEYDYLSSNSDELKNTILSSISFNQYTITEKFEHDCGDRYTNIFTKKPLKKYECTTKTGEKEILLGYRCSFNKEDSGYNYVYDILTGSIIYIGNLRENKFINVTEEDYNNDEDKSVYVLKEEFNSALDSNKEKEIPEEPKIEENLEVQETQYSEKDLYILNVESLQNLANEEDLVTISGTVSANYILYDTGEKNSENLSKWENILSENSEFSVGIYPNINYIDYWYWKDDIGEEMSFIGYIGSKEGSGIQNINDFLLSNHLEDLISKTGYYTKSDIQNINDYLNQKPLTRTLENNE